MVAQEISSPWRACLIPWRGRRCGMLSDQPLLVPQASSRVHDVEAGRLRGTGALERRRWLSCACAFPPTPAPGGGTTTSSHGYWLHHSDSGGFVRCRDEGCIARSVCLLVVDGVAGWSTRGGGGGPSPTEAAVVTRPWHRSRGRAVVARATILEAINSMGISSEITLLGRQQPS